MHEQVMHFMVWNTCRAQYESRPKQLPVNISCV